MAARFLRSVFRLIRDAFSAKAAAAVGSDLAAARLMLSLDQHDDVTSTDRALQTLWLDLPARTALVDALAPVRIDGLLRSGVTAIGYGYRVARGS